MTTERFIVVGDCGCDYGWVIDQDVYKRMSLWDRWIRPTLASVYGGTRYECYLVCDGLNQRKE